MNLAAPIRNAQLQWQITLVSPNREFYLVHTIVATHLFAFVILKRKGADIISVDIIIRLILFLDNAHRDDF